MQQKPSLIIIEGKQMEVGTAQFASRMATGLGWT